MSRATAAGAAWTRCFAAWRDTQARHGAARAYPYAWRLPDAARGLGRAASSHAQIALGLTLFQLGRYGAALDILTQAGDDGDALGATCTLLRTATRAACLHALGAHAQAGALAASAPLRATTPQASIVRVALAFLRDVPGDVPAGTDSAPIDPAAQEPAAMAEACITIGRYWAAARPDGHDAWASARSALVLLDRRLPVAGALAEAALAEALWRIRPAAATVWLDEALRQCARYGQHHLQARLMARKAQALLADGQLAEARRFERLAGTLAQRQGMAGQSWLPSPAGAPSG